MLDTRWPAVCAETIPCDVTYRMLQRPYGGKGMKTFDLGRQHSLPPDVVTVFRDVGDGLMQPTLVSLDSPMTDAQQHAISPWRHALDDAASPLVPSADERYKALAQWRRRGQPADAPTTSGRHSVPTGRLKLQKLHTECLRALRPASAAKAAAPSGGSRKRTPAAAVGAAASASGHALRPHCDVNDAQCLVGAHIQSDSSDDSVRGGELVLDGYAGERWEALAARRAAAPAPAPRLLPLSPSPPLTPSALPLCSPTAAPQTNPRYPNYVSVRAVEPRRPQPGVVTAATLARLPTRTTEVTIRMGCHTRALVHHRPHSVNSISTDDTSAVVAVPPVAGRAPRGKRPRA